MYEKHWTAIIHHNPFPDLRPFEKAAVLDAFCPHMGAHLGFGGQADLSRTGGVWLYIAILGFVKPNDKPWLIWLGMVGPLGFPSLLVNGMAKRNVSDVMQRMIFFAALEIDDFDRYVLLKRAFFVGGSKVSIATWYDGRHHRVHGSFAFQILDVQVYSTAQQQDKQMCLPSW